MQHRPQRIEPAGERETQTENENFAANRTKDPAYFESNEKEKNEENGKRKWKQYKQIERM